MRLMRSLFFAVAALVALSSSALAQSACPALTYNQVLTPGQWNACFAAKQDSLGYTPLNTAGGTMTGPLVTAGSTTFSAGLSVPQGTAPSSPQDGNVWATPAGLFGRFNGVTVGPFTNGSGAPTGSAGGDLTGTYPNPTVGTNKVTNAKAAQMAAVTLKGNPTNALANSSDFTISGLTALTSPDVTNDYLLIWDHTAGIFKKINPTTIAASATAGVSSLGGVTGAISLSSELAISTSTLGLTANGVAYSKLAQGAGLSIIGRSANSAGNNADIAAASDGQALRRNGTTIGFGALDLANANSVTGVLPNANLNIGATSDYLSAASGKILTADAVYSSGLTVSYSATQTLNFNLFQNATITLTGNITSFSCSGQKANQGGMIKFIQDGTGNRTLPATLGCNMKFSGGQPIASTAASTVDALFYSCFSSSECYGNYVKNWQ